MIRGRVLLLALLAMGIAAAGLGLVQMWFHPLDWEFFGKTMITLVVGGTLVSFLIAVDYDMAGSKGKILLGAAVCLSVALAGLILFQLWFGSIGAGTFGKLILTDLVLLGLISFIIAVTEDFGANKKLKDEKYID